MLPPNFSQIVVFGDSLSDIGNLFRFTRGALPNFPNFNGRASNGLLTVEILASLLGIEARPDNNYAVGGALSGRNNVVDDLGLGLELPGLLDQIYTFAPLVDGTGADPNGLYVVWAGVNDFLSLEPSAPLPPKLLDTTIQNLTIAINTLHNLGAQYIVVPNLPNLSRVPYTSITGLDEILPPQLSQNFNSALELALTSLPFDTISIDLFSLLEQIATNPSKFGFTNITDPFLSIDDDEASNPEQYLFWDDIHPTTRAHQIIAESFRSQILDPSIAEIPLNIEPNASNQPTPILDPSISEIPLNIEPNASNQPTPILDPSISEIPLNDEQIDDNTSNQASLIFGSTNVEIQLPLSTNENYIVFTGAGSDTINAVPPGSTRRDRLYSGSDNDVIIGSTNDRMFGSVGDDVLDTSAGNGSNRLYGSDGNDIFYIGQNDRVFGGNGDDQFYVGGGGNNIINGSAGADQFWIANAVLADAFNPNNGSLPSAINKITDFEVGVDVIGISGNFGSQLDAFDDLTLSIVNGNTTISAIGTEIAIIQGVENLGAESFVFRI
jgi:phospholipase/lecithinase/hemolysin